jgi:hypothetical protein
MKPVDSGEFFSMDETAAIRDARDLESLDPEIRGKLERLNMDEYLVQCVAVRLFESRSRSVRKTAPKHAPPGLDPSGAVLFAMSQIQGVPDDLPAKQACSASLSFGRVPLCPIPEDRNARPDRTLVRWPMISIMISFCHGQERKDS